VKTKRVGLVYKKNKFFIDAKVCNDFEKFSGLMFLRGEKAKALLFEFKKSKKIKIHSLFVFFPFIALWLDDKNKIVDLQIVKPFRFSVSSIRPFSKLIEIPFNSKYKNIWNLLISRRGRKI